MTAAPLRLEREQELAVVTFDSPPLNLFDQKLGAALESAIGELEGERPRAVLFRAEGRLVSGGVDVSVFAAHGLCLTWAFELALACDLIIAAQSASFGLVEKVIGLTPAMGGTQRL